jgi:hypothetical protein
MNRFRASGALLLAATAVILATACASVPADTTSVAGAGPPEPAWRLSDPVAGSQLSNFNRRWSVAWLFLDSMRYAEPRPDLGGIIVSSAHGGRMVLRYEGVRPGIEDWGNEQRLGGPRGELRILDESPGRVLIDAPREHQLFLRTEEPPEHFTLVPQEHEGDYEDLIWYPELVEKVAHGAVLRAIQLQATNYWYENDPALEPVWDDRTRPEAKLQSRRHGIAVELLADLANRAGVDFWYTLPHSAPDAYAQAAARVIGEALHPDARVFVELGNEVWNGIPPYLAQNLWMRDYADRRGERFAALEAEDAADDEYARAIMMHAVRTVEVGRIFERALGEERVVVVLAQQVGLGYFHDLARVELLGRGMASEVEALAIAPYFGASAQTLLGRAADEEILDAVEADLGEVFDAIGASAAAAERWGVPLIGYEGGQHMVPHHRVGGEWVPSGFETSHQVRAQMARINVSERMGELYRRWLSGWSDRGGGLMMHYGLIYQQDGIWGAWGLYDDTDSPPTPKSRAFYGWADYPVGPPR